MRIARTALAAARGTARVVTDVGSHAAWYVRHQVEGAAREDDRNAGS